MSFACKESVASYLSIGGLPGLKRLVYCQPHNSSGQPFLSASVGYHSVYISTIDQDAYFVLLKKLPQSNWSRSWVRADSCVGGLRSMYGFNDIIAVKVLSDVDVNAEVFTETLPSSPESDSSTRGSVHALPTMKPFKLMGLVGVWLFRCNTARASHGT